MHTRLCPKPCFIDLLIWNFHLSFIWSVRGVSGLASVKLWRLCEATWSSHTSSWWSHSQAYSPFFRFSHLLYSVLFSVNRGCCCPLYLKKNYEFSVWSFLSVTHHHLLLLQLPAGVTVWYRRGPLQASRSLSPSSRLPPGATVHLSARQVVAVTAPHHLPAVDLGAC